MTQQIAPIIALIHTPEGREWIMSLSETERMILPYMYDLWLRPEQRIEDYEWDYYGWITGRGWGKSTSIAFDITRRILAGQIQTLALMAPTEDRVEDVQFRFLKDASPPWCKAEVSDEHLYWPNGAEALMFTPKAPGRPRGGNFNAAWLTEIVDWQSTTRKEAFDNITTATRVGCSQVYWDTTSMGRNDVIQFLERQHADNPRAFRLKRGTTFDNPLLSARYLRAECAKYAGRKYEEEILGRSFAEAQGALFMQAWLDDHRALIPPSDPEIVIVPIDPALSTEAGSDLIGMCPMALGRDGCAYVLEDLSKRMKPEEWGDLAIDQYFKHPTCAGGVIERNHIGDSAVFVLRARAKERGLIVRELPRAKDRPFPRRTPGVFYVREYIAASSKATRAEGPAAKAEKGYLRLVGSMPDLENELTTYEPGSTRSPNRYDSVMYGAIELLDLALEKGRDPTPDEQTAREGEASLRARLAAMNISPRIGL